MVFKNITDLLKSDEKNLSWVWAIQEQNHLLHKHDAYWIDAAKNKWEADNDNNYGIDEFKNFLRTYQLLRGKFAKIVKEENKIKDIIAICNTHFGEKLQQDSLPAEATKRWNEVVGDLQDEGLVDDLLYSAASKIFWLYHPAVLPMYDKLARKGLRFSPDKKTINTFYYEFYAFYEKEKHNLETAKKFINFCYPYEKRIAEKYLWLQGNDKKEAILKRFKAGLEMIRNNS
jgi:hypothetical protein